MRVPCDRYWNSETLTHTLLDTREMKRVQCCATKLVLSLSDQSYQNHLITLDQPSLYICTTKVLEGI